MRIIAAFILGVVFGRLLCADAAQAAGWSRSSAGSIGALTLTGEIISTVTLAVEAHKLGDDIISYVAKYDENHIYNGRHETAEMLAYRSDLVEFDATTQLVASRSNTDNNLVAIARR